jgi:chorismate synthase
VLRYITAGESHGPALVSIVEGMPAGLQISIDTVNRELARRQLGYGRGGRMAIETDKAEVLSGIRFGKALGSPIALMIKNKDRANWTERMAIESKPEGIDVDVVTQPRPGHADLSGILKTGQDDIRNILERSSARETASRVAAGAIAKILLGEFGIKLVSHVVSIGNVPADLAGLSDVNTPKIPSPQDLDEIDRSPVRCFNKDAERGMISAIEKAIEDKNTLGGVFEILVYGCPAGIGGYASWEERLEGRIARAVMSVQAIKGVEIGEGFGLARKPGSEAHDEIFYEDETGYYHKTNRAGGIEGGMTNGEVVAVKAAMKPIPTLMRPLQTVDIITKQPVDAVKERSDVCAVPAAAVVGEAVVAFEIANAFLEKFGGDAIEDVLAAYDNYLKRTKTRKR